MIPHVHLSSACSFANDISDHYPIFLSCNKNFSVGFNKSKKNFKWSKHICNTQNTNILSHNYFSVLTSNLESIFDETSADDMVKEFINTSINVSKEIKTFILSKFKGPTFHTTIAIRNGRVSDNCPKFCPCCRKGDQTFIHWIFECSTFSLCQCKSLDFI